MTSTYILIAAILVLGGVIAALGDTLGSKVGKARLRLFNLRPRRTAMLITVMTGFSIAAFTLGVLFAFSKSLRQGLFELDSILTRLRETRTNLYETHQEKLRVESELQEAKIQQQQIQQDLANVDRNYQTAIAQLKNASSQASSLRADVRSLIAEKEQLSQQRESLRQQTVRLKQEIARQKQLSQDREKKITSQDRIIQEKEQLLVTLEKQQSSLAEKIEERDRILRQREIKLQQVERQFNFLNQQLEQYYQNFREKTIALFRGQILAFATVTIEEARDTTRIIERLLEQANLVALQSISPTEFDENKVRKIITIDRSEIGNIIEQVRQGREYVFRIISAGNYVEDEREIRVVADVAINRKIFRASQAIASIPIESSNITTDEIRQIIDILLSTSRFRARRSGILGKVEVEDGNFATLFNFFEELKNSEENPTSIKAVAITDAYTSGPLKLRLIAMRNGEVLFTT